MSKKTCISKKESENWAVQSEPCQGLILLFRHKKSIVYLAIAIQFFMLFFEHFFELVTNNFLPYLA